MMVFTIKTVRGITDKANRKTEREAQKEVKAIIRTLKAEEPEIYNYTFAEYLKNCTSKNGFLELIN